MLYRKRAQEIQEAGNPTLFLEELGAGYRIVEFRGEICLKSPVSRGFCCFLARAASVSVGFRGKELPREKREGRGREGRKRLQTNPRILKTVHFAFHA